MMDAIVTMIATESVVYSEMIATMSYVAMPTVYSDDGSPIQIEIGAC